MNNQKREELQRLLWMANVQGFYPDKSLVELEAGYQQWSLHREQFAQYYQKCYQQKNIDEWLSSRLNRLTNGILFTFHFGPYRLLPRYLVAAGYRITLLVSAAVLERERTQYARDLRAMGLQADRLECLNASDTLVLRKMLHAITSGRIILVFLDANESVVRDEGKEQQGRVRVAFGNSYFYWRINLIKLAIRFGLPVQVIHLLPMSQQGKRTWQMTEPLDVLTSGSNKCPMSLLNAFAKLQHVFQLMMKQDWTAWENWGLMHHYRAFDERVKIDTRCHGSLMIPFSFADKGYLFDLSRKLFYEIIAKKDNIY